MVRIAVLALLGALSLAAAAQEFPSRPVTIVTPFPAGSISDVVSRLTAERMQKAIGQPVLVENKPGLNGSVGAAQVTTEALRESAAIQMIWRALQGRAARPDRRGRR